MLYIQLHVKYRAVSFSYAFKSLINLFLWQLWSLRDQPYFWTVRLVRLSAGIQLPEKTEMVHLTSLMLSNKSSSWENLPKHTKSHRSDDRTWQNTLNITHLRTYTFISLIRGVYLWGNTSEVLWECYEMRLPHFGRVGLFFELSNMTVWTSSTALKTQRQINIAGAKLAMILLSQH